MIDMKKKRKFKWSSLIILIALLVFIYSSFKIVIWFIDNHKNNKIINDITDQITINEEISENVIKSEEIKEDDPYWDFIKMNLMDVDLTNLISINNDTVGWLKVLGTNINYPFVQASDNKYYLTHDFYKHYNGAGWVFLDYRNNKELNDQNNIIYAHGRANETMFGSLKNVLTNDWLNNQNNFVIEVSTKDKNSLWQVFSVYKVPNTNDYIETKFNNEDDFNNFINKLINRSIYDFKTTVNKNDHILTLSTCYNDNIKVVLHAKIIKIS